MELEGVNNVPVGMGGVFYLNNCAWDIFRYSDNKDELRKAIIWSDRAIWMEGKKPEGNMLDTKANLLYKLGNRREALALEKKALLLDPTNTDIQTELEKMRRREKTW